MKASQNIERRRVCSGSATERAFPVPTRLGFECQGSGPRLYGDFTIRQVRYFLQGSHLSMTTKVFVRRLMPARWSSTGRQRRHPRNSIRPAFLPSRTSVCPYSYSSSNAPPPFVFTGGIDYAKNRWLVRPELRYTHWRGQKFAADESMGFSRWNYISRTSARRQQSCIQLNSSMLVQEMFALVWVGI